MHLEICNSVLHFSCIETVLIKEELSVPSTLSEDKFAESTEVVIDNWDKQEKLHDMTGEMVNRLVIAKNNILFGSIQYLVGGGGRGGKGTVFSIPNVKKYFPSMYIL